jgi:transcriptional regulator with XRE-family HTH domain
LLAGRSGREVADHLGIGQASVSRMESGQAAVSVPHVNGWADAVNATAEQRALLLTMAETALNEVELWRTRERGDLAAMQTDVRNLAATARLYRCFQPTIVPGLLQTAEYARRVFALVDVLGGDDYAAAVAERLERQKILYDEDHQFDFVLTEAALRTQVVPRKILDIQRAHLANIASLDNVEVHVIPLDAEVGALGWCGFNIYDERGDLDPFVTIELPHAGITVSGSDDVALYRQQFDLLKESAVDLAAYLQG